VVAPELLMGVKSKSLLDAIRLKKTAASTGRRPPDQV
jgi:hypothetical protein